MATIASLEARYGANIIDFERELKRLQTINKRATDRVVNDHKASAKAANQAWAKADIGGAVNRSLGSGLGQLRGQLMASIAAITSGAGVAAAIGLADTYNRFTNSLKVAGLAGNELAAVQDHLFEAAGRNGVSVESLGQLYGRLASASKELGVNQTQLLQVTDAVSAAIRVSGQPISAASGAMLQMAQALGGGTVRAEEFNSMVEGMLPLVQAAAGASEKYGGSVAKMRNDVLAGKLSSKEFFDLILAGSAALEAKAAKAPLTVAQSFEQLKTKMIEAIGTTNEQWGITDRLSEALAWLSTNLDTVGNAIAVVVGIISIAMAPAIGKAALSLGGLAATTISYTAANLASIPAALGLAGSLRTMTSAAAAAAVGMRALLISTGVGIAIVALTAILGAFAMKSYEAGEATRDLASEIEAEKAAIDEETKAKVKSMNEQGKLTDEQMDGAKFAAALTGKTALLTTQQGLLALATWESVRAQMALNVAQAGGRRDAARADFTEAYAKNFNAVRRENVGRMGEVTRRGIGADTMSRSQVEAEALRRTKTEADRYQESVVQYRYRDSQYTRFLEKKDVEGVANDVNGNGRTTTGGPGPRRTSSGGSNTANEAERRERDYQKAIDAADRALLEAQWAAAKTTAEIYEANLAKIEDDRAVRNEEIGLDKDLNDAQRAELIGMWNGVYDEQRRNEEARRADEEKVEGREAQRAILDQQVEGIRLEEQRLTNLATNATDLEERHEYERQALAQKQRADDLIFEAEYEALRLQLEENGLTAAEVERLRLLRANRDTARAQETGVVTTRQNNERGPETIGQWAEQFRVAANAGEDFNTKLGNIANDGIQNLTNGLTDALMGAKSLGEAFGNMAQQMIASLVKLMVQWAIWEAIGLATGNGPGWGLKVIGLGGADKKSLPTKVGKNAMGTNFWHGGPTSINEKGEEIITLPSGSTVIPHNMVKAMKTAPKAMGGGQTIVNQITVDAKDAVLTQEVKSWIHEGVTSGMIATKAMIAQDQQKAGRNRLM